MENNLLITKKPKDLGFYDYFIGLDVFDKRTLISELELLKFIADGKKSTAKFTLIISIIVSLISVLFVPTFFIISFYIFLNICILINLIKKSKVSKDYSMIITHLEKNM
jgi:hypothetical protein